MKTFTIDINPKLKNVEITVKNGSKFTRSVIEGAYKVFQIEISEHDLKRVKKFAVKYSNDKSSNRGNWYAHCNGYSMDLTVANKGKYITINTYRTYGAAQF